AFFVFRGHARENAFVTCLLVVSLAFSFIVRRSNFMYMVYVYPAFLLLIYWIGDRYGRLRWTAGLLLAYLIPQYALVYVQNRDVNMERSLGQLRSLIPTGRAAIVGRPNDWFAFVDRPFFAAEYRGDFAAVAPDTFILVEGDAYRRGACPAVQRLA